MQARGPWTPAEQHLHTGPAAQHCACEGLGAWQIRPGAPLLLLCSLPALAAQKLPVHERPWVWHPAEALRRGTPAAVAGAGAAGAAVVGTPAGIGAAVGASLAKCHVAADGLPRGATTCGPATAAQVGAAEVLSVSAGSATSLAAAAAVPAAAGEANVGELAVSCPRKVRECLGRPQTWGHPEMGLYWALLRSRLHVFFLGLRTHLGHALRHQIGYPVPQSQQQQPQQLQRCQLLRYLAAAACAAAVLVPGRPAAGQAPAWQGQPIKSRSCIMPCAHVLMCLRCVEGSSTR